MLSVQQICSFSVLFWDWLSLSELYTQLGNGAGLSLVFLLSSEKKIFDFIHFYMVVDV